MRHNHVGEKRREKRIKDELERDGEQEKKKEKILAIDERQNYKFDLPSCLQFQF